MNARRNRPVKHPSSSVKILLAVTVLATAFYGGYWVGLQRAGQLSHEAHKGQEEHPPVSQTAAGGEGAGGKVGVVADLTFYDALPKQSVVPIPLSKPPSDEESRKPKAKAPVQSPVVEKKAEEPIRTVKEERERYRLQVASYRKRDLADQLAMSIRRMGYSAETKAVNIPGLGLRYRVYAGPYNNLARAEAVQRKLRADLHIQAMIQRIP